MCAGMFAHSSACMRAGHCTKAANMTNGLFQSQKHCCKTKVNGMVGGLLQVDGGSELRGQNVSRQRSTLPGLTSHPTLPLWHSSRFHFYLH